MSRQIMLDTETTGLETKEGHRIIEIGALVVESREITDETFHEYLNPDRMVDKEALEVHGISNQFLQDKPRFADVIDAFLKFVEGAEVVIHNAAFDVGFINHELHLCGINRRLEDYCTITDSLEYARKKHPGARNSLDALCKRYSISNEHRTLHGALLDSQILAQVYLAMTGGQTQLNLSQQASTENSQAGLFDLSNLPPLELVKATVQEQQQHDAWMQKHASKESGNH
ncbi:DNA polymerase III subunit epsilon [Marinicella sp. W31]|uniref:DNA polymerase III subunit epsilon n=1 Tax=Marinicella sp. W31 TaxID=3023713 RepID=UPI0037564310